MQRAGYRVIEADNAEEAFSSVGEAPALVLLNAESDERFRLVADGAPALIWVNGPDGCRFVNREAVVERRLFEATFRFRRYDGEYRVG